MAQFDKYILFAFLCATLVSGCGHIKKKEAAPEQKPIVVKTDLKSIEAGKILFAQKCERCHDPESETRRVGPGLRHILKNTFLPVSGNPATPDNVVQQMKHPMSVMPSFTYMTAEEVENLIAYLNTL